jgi:hypothetical protein
MAGDKISTVYLGQFSEEHAEAIVKGLEEAGITWWHKQAGRFAKFFFIGDWGVRLFVDRSRLEDAREIARRTAG